jgi:cardiolipin synthase
VPACGTPTGALTAGQTGTFAARNALAARADAIDAAVERITKRPATTDNSFQMHLDGPAAYTEMHALVKAARKSVWISTFEYHADAQGLALSMLLGAKAREGVEVKVLVDKLGSSLEKETASFLQLIRDAGGEVRAYEPVWVHDFLGIHHRKLYLFDGQVAMTGGMNIGDAYYQDFHDTLGTIRGSAVTTMAQEFFRDWRQSGGKAPKALPEAPRGGESKVRVLTTSSYEKRTEILDGLTAAIGAARDHIDLAVPYLTDDDLIELLQDAARRGVKVRVTIPIPRASKKADVGVIFNRVNPTSARKLMAAGAEVRYYLGKKLHLKVTEIDGAWVCYGSANGDTMSYLRNQELNLAIADPAVAADVRQRLFEADTPLTRPITEADLKLSAFDWPIQTALDALSYYLGVRPPAR